MKTQKADLKSDYLSGAAALRPHYQYAFPLQDYGELLRDKARDPMDRETLVQVLRGQNQHLPNAEAVLANIEKLQQENAFTTTTGHQLVLMGGPMYTLYKIASAIRMAEIIQHKHPEYAIVPVFWMATEDHDWEEINHFHADFDTRITYPGSFQGAVGRHLLEDSIRETLAGVPENLSRFFVPGKKYAEAFREFIHHLFGHTGLVIVDADDPRLKRLFLPAMQRELEGQGMADHIRESNEQLAAEGYKRQIHPRTVNLFYLGNGDRELIEKLENGDFSFKGSDQIIPQAGLMARLESHPEDFSPNVACRPLYQESILPNLAYVGGWAETAYWMQLRAAFAAARINFPLLVPRMHATMITADQAAQLRKLGLNAPDLDLQLHELNDLYLSQNWSDEELQQTLSGVDAAYEKLAAYLESVDPTLATSVRADQARANKSLDKLSKKVRKSVRNQDPQPYREIAALKNGISPENKQQQRVLNFTAFSDFASADIVETILKHCHPDQFADQWIVLP